MRPHSVVFITSVYSLVVTQLIVHIYNRLSGCVTSMSSITEETASRYIKSYINIASLLYVFILHIMVKFVRNTHTVLCSAL